MSQIKSHQFMDLLTEVLVSNGKVALPNVEPIEDAAQALSLISSCSKQADTPYQLRLNQESQRVVYYAKIFLQTGGMASKFNGAGVILASGKAYKFHMCDHTWDESGANHRRGWHPKRCTKCGFDASIDSGD